MSPSAIVIHFHILKDLPSRFIPGPELMPVDQLDLERVEKTLRNGIIPAITLPAHAPDELVLSQDRLEVIAGILTTPIRMADKALRRVAPKDRLPHGLYRQCVGNGFIHRQTNDAA